MNGFRIFLLAVCIGTLVFAVDIVKNGQSASVIVLDEKPTRSAQFAAEELKFHIRKMTGAEIEIVRQKKSGKTNIYVGKNSVRQESFAEQEYLVEVNGGDIFLNGRDAEDYGVLDYSNAGTYPDMWNGVGTCYAVYDFLEKLGVRWYLPTELGIHFKFRDNLSVDDMKIRRQPFMEYRNPYIGNGFSSDLIADTLKNGNESRLSAKETTLWLLRSRVGGHMYQINHSLYSYYNRFPDKKEWFAKGYNGQPPQMCYTNEEFIQQVIQDARDYFDGKANPSVAGLQMKGLDCFPVFPMDNASWCKCEKCQALLKKEAEQGKGGFSNDRASNYIFTFVNRVAKEIQKSHPGKLIGTGAYHEYCYPPTGIELEKNIRLIACLHARGVYNPDGMENDRKILEAWTKAAPYIKKNVWLYFCFPALNGSQQSIRVFPGFFASHVEEIFRSYASNNVCGTFIEPSYGAKYTIILMDQLEAYLYWRLAWNDELNGEQIISEFFRDYYGPAESVMKEMYMLIQERFTNPKYRTKNGNIENISWNDLGTAEVMERLDALMGQAVGVAQEEPYKSRVELYKKGIHDFMMHGRKTFVNRAAQMSGTMMQADVPLMEGIDGDPAKINWDKAANLRLYGGLHAEPLKEKIEIKVAHDGTWLYLECIHNGIDPEKLQKNTVLWQNDEWECYFAKQRSRPYQMFGVDANCSVNGFKFLELNSGEWVPEVKVTEVKRSDGWTLQLAMKLADIVPGGIRPGQMLYFNVLRTRDNNAFGCWIPTFGGFHAPERFGELYLMEE